MAGPPREARGTKSAPPTRKRTLDHIRIKPADNGGHVVQHHYQYSDGMYSGEPDEFVFNAADGQKLLDHVKQYARVKVGKAKAEES